MIALLCASAVILCGMMLFGLPHSLDARLYYDQMEAWSFFQTLSPEDTTRYFWNELADLVLIGVYSTAFYLALERLGGWKKPYLKIALIPGIFDFIETTWILMILKTGQIAEPMLWLGWVTCLK